MNPPTMADELAADEPTAREKRAQKKALLRGRKRAPEEVRLVPTPRRPRIVGYIDDEMTFPLPMSEEP